MMNLNSKKPVKMTVQSALRSQANVMFAKIATIGFANLVLEISTIVHIADKT